MVPHCGRSRQRWEPRAPVILAVCLVLVILLAYYAVKLAAERPYAAGVAVVAAALAGVTCGCLARRRLRM